MHKLPHGNIDLQFGRMAGRVAELRERITAQLSPDMIVSIAGGSAVVRLKAEPINPGRPYDEQRDAAIAGIEAAQRLLTLSQELSRKG